MSTSRWARSSPARSRPSWSTSTIPFARARCSRNWTRAATARNTTPPQASLESARAEVRIAEARLKRASADEGQAAGQKTVLAARLDEVRIAADNALKTAKRKTQLSTSGIVSAVDAQETTARSDVASASVNEAQAILDAQAQVEAGSRADYLRAGAELEVAQAAVKRLESQLEAARIDLERTRIRSPIDGVIVGRNVNEGQTLASALETRTLFVVAADLRSMEVYARVDESDISQVAPGQPAQFTVDAFPGRVFEATVKQVRKAPVLVQNVVTYVVVLTAPNEDLALLPGMTAVTRIETARAVASLSVPLAALRLPPAAGFRASREVDGDLRKSGCCAQARRPRFPCGSARRTATGRR